LRMWLDLAFVGLYGYSMFRVKKWTFRIGITLRKLPSKTALMPLKVLLIDEWVTDREIRHFAMTSGSQVSQEVRLL
jgi:hypothetical protein